MLDSPKQRSGKRKRLGAPPTASLVPAGDSEQALRALEAYANQAEEALGEALDEVALKDRRIAALETELRSQRHPAAARPLEARPAVVLPNLSPPLSRSAHQTRQALEAIGRHTGEAEQALAELLAAAEEKEQGFEELQAQLHETRNELQQQQQRAAAEALEAASGKDRQIAELVLQRRRVEESLAESRRQLAAREGRLEALEKEIDQVRSTCGEQAHQLSQMREVLEHYVLRCRDLEHRAPQASPAAASAHSGAGLSPMALRLKTQLQQKLSNGAAENGKRTDVPSSVASELAAAAAVATAATADALNAAESSETGSKPTTDIAPEAGPATASEPATEAAFLAGSDSSAAAPAAAPEPPPSIPLHQLHQLRSEASNDEQPSHSHS